MTIVPDRATLRPGRCPPGERRAARRSRVVCTRGRVRAEGLASRPDTVERHDVVAVLSDPVRTEGGGGDSRRSLGFRFDDDGVALLPLSDWSPVLRGPDAQRKVAATLAARIGVKVDDRPVSDVSSATWWYADRPRRLLGHLVVRAGVVAVGVPLIGGIIVSPTNPIAPGEVAAIEPWFTTAAALSLMLAVLVSGLWVWRRLRDGRLDAELVARPDPAVPVTRRFLRRAHISRRGDELVSVSPAGEETHVPGRRDDLGAVDVVSGDLPHRGVDKPAILLLDRFGSALAVLDRELWFGTATSWSAAEQTFRSLGLQVRGTVPAPLATVQMRMNEFVDPRHPALRRAGLARQPLAQMVGLAVIPLPAALFNEWTVAAALGGAAVVLTVGPALLRVASSALWWGREVGP